MTIDSPWVMWGVAGVVYILGMVGYVALESYGEFLKTWWLSWGEPKPLFPSRYMADRQREQGRISVIRKPHKLHRNTTRGHNE